LHFDIGSGRLIGLDTASSRFVELDKA
jgi:hypothetical protein